MLYCSFVSHLHNYDNVLHELFSLLFFQYLPLLRCSTSSGVCVCTLRCVHAHFYHAQSMSYPWIFFLLWFAVFFLSCSFTLCLAFVFAATPKIMRKTHRMRHRMPSAKLHIPVFNEKRVFFCSLCVISALFQRSKNVLLRSNSKSSSFYIQYSSTFNIIFQQIQAVNFNEKH